MSLEIIIKDNMIKIAADWFWYVLICVWMVFVIINNTQGIYYKHLRRKLDKLNRKGVGTK